jgi:hypothetical protein
VDVRVRRRHHSRRGRRRYVMRKRFFYDLRIGFAPAKTFFQPQWRGEHL